MGLTVRHNSIHFGAFGALELLLSMFSGVVLFDSCQVSQCSGRMVVHTIRFRANVHLFFVLFWTPLPQLPGEIVASSVKL